MKPAIYYAVVNPRYSGSKENEIRTATSAKGHRVWGRDEHGNPTNWTRNDEDGRFNTLEEAQASVKTVQKSTAAIREEYEATRRRADALYRQYLTDRKNAVAEVSTYKG